MTAATELHGALFPLPTPFTDDGELNVSVLADMTHYYSEAGADGFFLFGSFGQGPAMTPTERKTALEVVMDNLDRKLPIVVHVGTVDPYTARDMARHADAIGVDAIAICGPFYYTDRSPEDLALHVQLIDDAIETPLFFYNNPAYQGYPISPQTLKQIYSNTSGLVGIKIAKGSMEEAREYREVFGDDVRLFAPVDILEGLRSGVINGTVNPLMCSMPELGFATVHAVESGDLPLAEKYMTAMDEFLSVLSPLIEEFGYRGPFGIAMQHLGFEMRYPRWPTQPIPEAKAAALFAAIDRARQAVRTLAPTGN